MSEWKRHGGGMTAAIAAILGKCRAMAHARKQAGMQRAAGNEAKAQVLEHRAATGKVGAASRLAQARELMAQRHAAQNPKSPPLTPKTSPQKAAIHTGPSLREQAAQHRAAKGTREQRVVKIAKRANQINKGILGRQQQTLKNAKKLGAKAEPQIRHHQARVSSIVGRVKPLLDRERAAAKPPDVAGAKARAVAKQTAAGNGPPTTAAHHEAKAREYRERALEAKGSAKTTLAAKAYQHEGKARALRSAEANTATVKTPTVVDKARAVAQRAKEPVVVQKAKSGPRGGAIPPKPKAAPVPAKPAVPDVRKTIAQHKTAEAQHNAVVAHVRAHSTDAGHVKEHGMASSTPMRKLHFEGHEVHYEASAAGEHMAAHQIHELASGPKLAEPLTRHTKRIILTHQASAHDAVWQQKFNNPNHRSAATGGNGDIVVYNGQHVSRGIIAHEMGHNLARAKYGSADPTEGSDFHKAATAGGAAPTAYAQNAHKATGSHSEDFAESVRMYHERSAEFKLAHPERHGVIHRLMTDANYHG